MSETPENPTARTSTATDVAPAPSTEAPHKTPKVFQFAAWVAIVAGIAFIVAVIFFSGFVLGRHAVFHGSFHHHGHHKHHAMMMHPRGPGGPGGGGPAAIPGGGPGTMRSGAGPGQVPSSVSPSLTPSP